MRVVNKSACVVSIGEQRDPNIDFGSACTRASPECLVCHFRHVAVLMDTIKKGVHDADSEARSVARK